MHAIPCNTMEHMNHMIWLLVHSNYFNSYVCLMSDQLNKANKMQPIEKRGEVKRRKAKQRKKGKKTLWIISGIAFAYELFFLLLLFFPFYSHYFCDFPFAMKSHTQIFQRYAFSQDGTILPFVCNSISFLFFFTQNTKILQIEFFLFFAQTFAETQKKCAIHEMITLCSNYEHTIRKIIQVSCIVLFWFMIHFISHACLDPQTLLYQIFFGMLPNLTNVRSQLPPKYGLSSTKDRKHLCDAFL